MARDPVKGLSELFNKDARSAVCAGDLQEVVVAVRDYIDEKCRSIEKASGATHTVMSSGVEGDMVFTSSIGFSDPGDGMVDEVTPEVAEVVADGDDGEEEETEEEEEEADEEPEPEAEPEPEPEPVEEPGEPSPGLVPSEPEEPEGPTEPDEDGEYTGFVAPVGDEPVGPIDDPSPGLVPAEPDDAELIAV